MILASMRWTWLPALLSLAACQTPAPVTQSADRPRVEPPEQRCPGAVVPADRELAARINISVERLQQIKSRRKLSNADICRANQIRLASMLERTDPFAPTHGAEALAWRALAEQDEFGEIRPDGRMIAALQRNAL